MKANDDDDDDDDDDDGGDNECGSFMFSHDHLGIVGLHDQQLIKSHPLPRDETGVAATVMEQVVTNHCVVYQTDLTDDQMEPGVIRRKSIPVRTIDLTFM
ncbi:hypothetical protein D915_005641 [Fasciola hepatica]|uniref:Uncharacterized protein n=1 Tax=Fasciola hepatica TaxID=6192 RepID=A0A4E0RA96_FASHE|nr:hypothetical protein D915_005641 [Fasciola hepatica]